MLNGLMMRITMWVMMMMDVMKMLHNSGRIKVTSFIGPQCKSIPIPMRAAFNENIKQRDNLNKQYYPVSPRLVVCPNQNVSFVFQKTSNLLSPSTWTQTLTELPPASATWQILTTTETCVSLILKSWDLPCLIQQPTGPRGPPKRCFRSRNHNWSKLCLSQTGRPFYVLSMRFSTESMCNAMSSRNWHEKFDIWPFLHHT